MTAQLNLLNSTIRLVKNALFYRKISAGGRGGYISLPVGFSALCAARSPAAPPPSVYRFFSGLKRGFCWCFWGGFLLVVFRFLFVCFKTLFFVFQDFGALAVFGSPFLFRRWRIFCIWSVRVSGSLFCSAVQVFERLFFAALRHFSPPLAALRH